MSGAGDLYPPELLALAEDDSHHGELDSGCAGEAKNPLCGDRLRATFVVEDGIIRAARFTARGCAISKASAAKMAALVEGKTVPEALQLRDALESTVDRNGPEDTNPALDAFKGLRKAPTRKRCATLAWEALAKAVG